MERHIKILAILHIVNGVLILAGGFFTFFFGLMHGLFGGFPHPFRHLYIFDLGLMSGLLSVVFTSVIAPLFIGLPGIVAGFGLYNRKNWGRILVLIVGVICLIKFPWGTALGIYTLWILLKPESAQLMTS